MNIDGLFKIFKGSSMTAKKGCALFFLTRFFIIGVFVYLLVDSSVSPIAIELDRQFEQHQQNATQAQIDSYYYQMGMGYETENISIDNTIAIGKSIVEQIDAIEKNDKLTVTEKSQQFSQVLDNYKGLQSETSFCSTIATSKTNDCIDITQSSPEQWQQAITDGQSIRMQYQHFLMLEPAVTLSSMSPYVPTPKWSLLLKGQRVANVEYLLLAKAGQSQVAIDNLLTDFTKLRQHFALSDTIIKKLVLQKMLLEQLQMMAIIKTQYDTDNKPSILPIASLNAIETSIEMSIIYEYQSLVYVIRNLSNDDIGLIQKLAIYFFLKQQETINNLAEYYQQKIEQNKISANEFANKMNSCQDANEQAIDSTVKNYVGGILINLAMTDISSYEQKIFSINNMINMVNHVLTNGKTPLSNVYTPTLSDVNISDEQICMPYPTRCNQATNSDNQNSHDNQTCLILKFDKAEHQSLN